MTTPPETSSPLSHRGRKLMRIKALVRKEFLQVRRDPSSIAIAFLMPVVLLMFGYGVSLDAYDVPLAIVAEAPCPETASFTGSFTNSHWFHPKPMAGMREALDAMRHGEVMGIVHLREDFARDLHRPQGAQIQLIVNGVDANTARIVEGYVQGVWTGWLAKQAEAKGESVNPPAPLEFRIWYNPDVRSRDFLVPGLIAVIMTLIGALLTAMVMAREWERGTMEALLVTPVRMGELLLGKLITYFGMGVGGMLLSVVLAVWVFQVPLRGSLWVLLATSCLFLIAALGMGLLISTVAKVQFVAGQMALITTFMPAFLLSGFIFDIDSMPKAVQVITHVVAARYFVAILQTVFLAGNVWPIILTNSAALVVMAVVFLGLVRKRSRKNLE